MWRTGEPACGPDHRDAFLNQTPRSDPGAGRRLTHRVGAGDAT